MSWTVKYDGEDQEAITVFISLPTIKEFNSRGLTNLRSDIGFSWFVLLGDNRPAFVSNADLTLPVCTLPVKRRRPANAEHRLCPGCVYTNTPVMTMIYYTDPADRSTRLAAGRISNILLCSVEKSMVVRVTGRNMKDRYLVKTQLETPIPAERCNLQWKAVEMIRREVLRPVDDELSLSQRILYLQLLHYMYGDDAEKIRDTLRLIADGGEDASWLSPS